MDILGKEVRSEFASMTACRRIADESLKLAAPPD